MLEQSISSDEDGECVPREKEGDLGESDHWLLESLLRPQLSFSDEDDLMCEPPPGDPKEPRIHELCDDPQTDPDHKTIWRYTPTDARRLYGDVQYVADADTFVGRILLAITRGGDSKNFEEITGQDGLTFGITDFAGNQGCRDFFQKFYEN